MNHIGIDRFSQDMPKIPHLRQPHQLHESHGSEDPGSAKHTDRRHGAFSPMQGHGISFLFGVALFNGAGLQQKTDIFAT